MESVILYLIVGAIYLFLNMKKAKDKKKNPPKSAPQGESQDGTTPAPTQKQPETFGDLFESLFGEPSKPQTKTVQAPSPVKEQAKTQEKEYGEVLDEQRNRSLEKRKNEQAARYQKEKDQKAQLDIERKKAAHLRHMAEKARLQNNANMPIRKKKSKTKFNLREAIIAQVILERPYK